MRICHIITRMILGGAQENTLLTCQGLHARGHEVILITGPALGPEGDLLSRAQEAGYRVIVLPELRREISLWRDYKALRAIKAHLAEISPRVVHTHSSKAGILGRRAAHRLGCMKIVHTVHGLAFHSREKPRRNRLYIRLEKQAAAWTDAIISVADAMTHQALAAGVGRPEQYTTIYSGMELEPYLSRPAQADAFRASLGLGPDATLLTQVSRLAEWKGHEFLLAAAERINDPNVHFCFVGDGALRGQIEKQIARRNLTKRVHLTGLLPPGQIPAVMHASDVVVHCSLREGLARALPQAMLAGRPVVSFDVDGAREVVDGQTGALVPPEDVDALVEALGTLIRNPERRFLLGAAGRERCKQRFDHNVMVERIETLYERICHTGP
ncbi:MAG: glycosyltransferase family 4 protein [Phycisphaerae bacterium]|nr:glycosyltransferase family 4 protein [Phycisphaerae bacterium]